LMGCVPATNWWVDRARDQSKLKKRK
jgi:hypothetical protein